MPRNGSGTYLPPGGTFGVNGAIIDEVAYNDFVTDISTAMSESVNISGTKPWTAAQSMGGFRITSLGAGTGLTDAANVQQVQQRTAAWAQAAGTGDVITATYTPTITAYTDGMTLGLRALAPNTVAAPTANFNSVGARKIFKAAGSSLVAGDIAGAGHDLQLTYNSSLDASAGGWLLHNPQSTQSVSIIGETELTAIATDDSFLIYDLSATTNKRITATNLFDVISLWTEDTTPDANADYVSTWDASASSVKKVALKNLRPLEFWEYAIGDETTTITAGTNKITVRAPKALTVIPAGARASLTTAGGLVVFDINQNGVSILGNKLSIDSGEKTSTTAATAVTITTTSIADDAELTIDVDSVVGSPAGAKIRIYGYPA